MKNLLIPLFLIGITTLFAQNTIKGVVIDAQTHTPIPNTEINNSKNEIILTSINGRFTISQTDTLYIKAKGYFEKKIAVTSKSKITIALVPNPNELYEVHISTNNSTQQLKTIPQSIHIINKKALNNGNSMEFSPILNRVSGVFMQSGALNTNRITIRGIGARSPFGTTGIRAYFGDIPLTDGNSNSAIEDLELASLSRIEIHKGPTASSFGAGLGGVILLIPEKTAFQTTKGAIQTTLGSYGLQRISAQIAHSGNTADLNVIYSNTHSDGYRENNQYDRQTLTATSSVFLGDKNTLKFVGSYVDLKAFIPSSIDKITFENTPREAATAWKNAKGFEDTRFGVLGANWEYRYKENLGQYSSVFTSFRSNNEPRPFNILREKTNAYGIRTRLKGNLFRDKNALEWTLGGELFLDLATTATYENLFRNFPLGTGSVQGNMFSELEERRSYYNIFLTSTYAIHSKWKASLGINLNQTYFKTKDQFLTDNEDRSGDFDFDPIASPKIGITYSPMESLHFFGTIAHGFNTPTTEETLLPEGILNPDLEPETGWNFELGSRFGAFKQKIQGDFSIYVLDVNNLLVNRRAPTDELFAINAGKTRHIGMELSLKYYWITNQNLTLQTFINSTINNFKFKEFVTLDNNFSGNDLTGVPSEIISFGNTLSAKKGIYGTLDYLYVGSMPADDANTIYTESYSLLNTKIGYRKTFFKSFEINGYIGIQNILDQKYVSQLQVNASGFNNASPRYFYPGNPQNFYGGININYSLKN